MKRFTIVILIALMAVMGLQSHAESKMKKLDFSIQEVIQEANAGSADAQCFLGYCLINGINTNIDYNKAAEWLSKAAAQGNKPAMYYLATIRYAINGMEQEYKNAADYLRQLTSSTTSKNSDDDSGNYTLVGRGLLDISMSGSTSLDYDDNTFVKGLRSQATKDNPSALYLLSSFTEESEQQKTTWLRRAAELGHAEAQYQLAVNLCESFYKKNDSEVIINEEILINDEVIKWLKASADQGHLPAIKGLAYCYASDNKYHDYNQAIKYYMQAANLGDKESRLIVGNYYFMGKGMTRNYTEAMKWYNLVANGDDYIAGDAYSHLGDCYFYGYGVQQSYGKAIEYYNKIKDYHSVDNSWLNMATYYENNQQQNKAIEYYRKAASSAVYPGTTIAHNAALTLADYYYSGTHGLIQDFKQAAYYYAIGNFILISEDIKSSQWFQKLVKAEEAQQEQEGGYVEETNEDIMFDLDKYANLDIVKQARQGNVQAQLKLGKMLLNEYSDEVPEFDESVFDYNQAAAWFRKAANQGSAEAQYYLANCLEMMQLGEDVDASTQKQILDLYEKAARAGIVQAQFEMARTLERKDFEDAYSYDEKEPVDEIDKPYADWYRKAAQNGVAEAQWWIGDNDYEEAYLWFSKAANQGYVDAYYSLAECYFDGNGVAPNTNKGIEWLTKAANAGYGISAKALADRYYNGDGIGRNYEKAVYWYTIAANAEESLGSGSYMQEPDIAQNLLGQCYRDGTGVTRDYKKAVYWFRRAAERGNTDAEKNLSDCYKKGLGVPVDTSQAAWWLKLSKRFDE